MSGIAKPGLFTPNSDAGAVSEPVNLEQCKTITKKDVPNYVTQPNQAAKDRFEMTFHMLGTDNQTKEVTWVYRDVAGAEAARDADFTAAVTAFAASL